MSIRAVLFDLDDTLVVDEAISSAAFEAVAQQAFTRLGTDPGEFVRTAKQLARRLHAESPVHPYCQRIGISAFECLWGKFDGTTSDLTRLREWAHVYRGQVFDATLRAMGIEQIEDADELADAFANQRRRLQRLMPDAREVLTRLSAHYSLGLLTNGAPDLQREKILNSGLGSFFQAIAISGEHDIGKPNAAIFHRLIGELGVGPAEAVMVGNSLERDIQGARNAGIRNVWIRVSGSEETAAVHPEHSISALLELPAVIEAIDLVSI